MPDKAQQILMTRQQPSGDIERRNCRSADDRVARWHGSNEEYTIDSKRMNLSALFNEITGLYHKHGWQLRRVLLRPETLSRLQPDLVAKENTAVMEGAVDALWFSRPSHEGREAWELRILAENPYALFETFEADETEEQRDDMRLEMEARMREYVNK